MKKAILLFLFIPVFLFAEKILIQGHLVPGVNPVVDDSTWNFYKKEKEKQLLKNIQDNLKEYYKTAWETYFTNKAKLPSCFQDALDNLHTKVSEIKLLSNLGNAGAYFFSKGMMGTLNGVETKIVNGEMIDYAGDIGGTGQTDLKGTIAINEAFKSPANNIKYTTKSGECDLEDVTDWFNLKVAETEYATDQQREWIKNLKNEWQPAGASERSIPALIFHELIHMALNYSNSSRKNDDATVDDVMIKIFGDSVAIYKAKYDYYLWEYIQKKKNPVFEYYSDNGKERAYNPPDSNGLVYGEVKDYVKTITKGIHFLTRKTINLTYTNANEDCQDARCEPMKDYIIPYLCKCDPKAKCAPEPPGGGSGDSGPAGDSPDDNYSFSSGTVQEFNLFPEAVILTQGYWREAMKLYGGLKAVPEFTANALFESTPFLIVPSGGLFGLENDSVFKAVLQEYVRLGGNIIVFAQQYGSHIDKVVPIPEGESLHSYGFREDQSCTGAAGYFKQMHPALAAMPAQNAYVNVDGYFAAYPDNATVLLKRTSNQQPCLLYYPYGNGTVILTSMYTDWGGAHSQASIYERMLVRDLITFAKNPNLAIPMYNLTTDPNPDISLNVTVKNDTETATSKVKIKVYTPDRSTLLFETEASLALAADSEGTIPVSFILGATLNRMQLGLCHTDYELYDAEGNIVQMASEADSGRFAV